MDRPTLSSAGPTVLFRGQYVFRTFSGTMAVILPLVTSAIAAAAAVYLANADDELLSNFVAVVFGVAAMIFGGAGLWTLWSWISNRRVDVEINADGIIHGNRFWSWDRVRSFAGKRYDNGILLEFTPRGMPILGGGALATTPLLTEQQYIELARELSRCLSSRFPHVEVVLHPHKAAAKS